MASSANYDKNGHGRGGSNGSRNSRCQQPSSASSLSNQKRRRGGGGGVVVLVVALSLMSVYVAILYHQMVWSQPAHEEQQYEGHAYRNDKGNDPSFNVDQRINKNVQRSIKSPAKKKKKKTVNLPTSRQKSQQEVKDSMTTTRTNTNNASHSTPRNNDHNNIHPDQHHDITSMEHVSACLLVMDDNHFLIEWLAYHYHVLPLRYLIVAVDPRSQTSPTSIFNRYRRHHSFLNMTILEWNDDDFMTQPVDQYILKRLDDQHNLILLQHRARQRMFFYRCLQTIQEEHVKRMSSTTTATTASAWTLLADTDEYVVLNQHVLQTRYKNQTTHVPTIQEPGSVLRLLKLEQQQEQQRAQDGLQEEFEELDDNEVQGESPNEEGDEEDSTMSDSAITTNTTSKHRHRRRRPHQAVPPCFQIPRLRFGIRESSLSQQRHQVPSALNASSFLTLRWRYHAKRTNVRLNKISKSMIDLTRIPRQAIEPVMSVHRPVQQYCTQRQLHKANQDSVLVIHHYLGTWEQYNFRNDAREGEFMRGAYVYRKATKAQALENDDARLWLKGFVESVGETVALDLLRDVGYVPPKRIASSSSSTALAQSKQTRVQNLREQPQQLQVSDSQTLEETCALLFFGLPRAYGTLVLPSVIQNVLWPNARHHCDVFVHYFYMTQEPEGRKNKGGAIDPEAIRLLENAVHMVAKNYSSTASSPLSRMPHVDFMYDTEEAFWMERNATIQKYRTTKDKNGKYLYFPWNAKSYVYPSSLDNIVKQWHSIESVWELMERAMRQGIANYTRVAMLRSDVLYATPIDIYNTSWLAKKEDRVNRYAVVPPFGLMPVNDRLIYGPYSAIKIWATKRFEYIDYHVMHYPDPGYGMHSERFLEGSIFTAMVNQTGVEIVNNPDICFFRTRADDSAMISDCEMGGESRGIKLVDKVELVKTITGLGKCEKYKMGRQFSALKCLKG